MTAPLDVCIRGAGIVGRTLALMLARQHLRVGLVRAPAASTGPDVRAYALNHAARQVLESVRCWPDARGAAPVQGMRVWGDAGGVVSFDAPAADQAAGAAQALTWIVDVPLLEAQLDQALSFAPQVHWLDAPQAAPLTVICEGRASVSRAGLGVDYAMTPYEQTAVAARLRCERRHHGVAYQWFGQQHDILGVLPLPEGGNSVSTAAENGAAEPTGHRVAVVWSVPPERAAELCVCPAADFTAAMRAAMQVNGTPLLGMLELCSERAAWPLVRAVAERWTGPMPGGAPGASWVLAGDSAHAVHPLAGQGLNLGLGDVAELARVLATRQGAEYWRSVGDARLLRRYERARRAELASLGTAMDGIQRLFAHPHPLAQRLRNWGMSGFERSGPVKTWVARQAMGA